MLLKRNTNTLTAKGGGKHSPLGLQSCQTTVLLPACIDYVCIYNVLNLAEIKFSKCLNSVCILHCGIMTKHPNSKKLPSYYICRKIDF